MPRGLMQKPTKVNLLDIIEGLLRAVENAGVISNFTPLAKDALREYRRVPPAPEQC